MTSLKGQGSGFGLRVRGALLDQREGKVEPVEVNIGRDEQVVSGGVPG